MTKSQILDAARKKWGKNVELRENRAAPTPAAKGSLREPQKELLERKKAADEGRKSLGDVNGPLLEAARFALDVDGDEPSSSQLRQATERAERGERESLQRFKDWVHAWLDGRGVPSDPGQEKNSRTGCRIGGRLEWFAGRVAELEGALRSLPASSCNGKGADAPAVPLADDAKEQSNAAEAPQAREGAGRREE